MRGEEEERGEMGTVIGSGGAFYRQKHSRGARWDDQLRVMCDLEGSRWILVGDSGVALGGSSFSAVHLRCI